MPRPHIRSPASSAMVQTITGPMPARSATFGTLGMGVRHLRTVASMVSICLLAL